MSGLGGLNKSPEGVVVGVVQLQLPVVATRDELAAQTTRICDMVGKARRNLPTMDLVVFPEYALHGLSMDINPEIMCRVEPTFRKSSSGFARGSLWREPVAAFSGIAPILRRSLLATSVWPRPWAAGKNLRVAPPT